MRRDTAEAAAVAGLAFAVHAAYAGWGLLIQDEGWLLQAAQRVASGETPYSDFATAYAPGRYVLVAAVLKAFGPDLHAVRLLFAALRALVVLLVFLLARRLGTRRLAWGAAALATLLPGPWHKTFFALVPLAVLVPLARWQAGAGLRWVVLAGAMAGAGFWFRQDAAVAAGVAAAAAVAWRRPRALAPLAIAGGVALLLPLAALAGRGVAPAEVARQTVVDAWHIGHPERGILQRALLVDGGRPALPHRPALIALCWAGPVLAVAGLRVAGRRGRDDPRGASLAALSIVCLLLANQVFRYEVLVRFLQMGALVYLLYLAVVAELPAPARVPLLLLPAAFAAYVLFDGSARTLPVEYTGTVAVCARPSVPLDVRGHRVHVPPELADELGRLAESVRSRTAPTEPVLVLGEPAILHFLADRTSPARRIRIEPEHLGELDAAFWSGVRARGCRHVVVPEAWTGETWRRGLDAAGRPPERVERIGPWAIWRLT